MVLVLPTSLNRLLHPCSPSRGLHFTPLLILAYSRPNNKHGFHTFSYFVPHITLELTPPWSQALFSQLGFRLSLKTKLKNLPLFTIHPRAPAKTSIHFPHPCVSVCSLMHASGRVRGHAHYKCTYVINTESFWW